MFEGDSADMCAGKFLLVSMGDWAEGLACADPGARTPIGASGILYNYHHHLWVALLSFASPLFYFCNSQLLMGSGSGSALTSSFLPSGRCLHLVGANISFPSTLYVLQRFIRVCFLSLISNCHLLQHSSSSFQPFQTFWSALALNLTKLQPRPMPLIST